MSIIINDDKLSKEEVNEYTAKVRALLVDDKCQILIAKYGNVILLPGGSIDEDEVANASLIRELTEETGIDYEITELDYLNNINYYQRDYPKRDGTKTNRLVQTHYFIGQYKGVAINKQHLTEKETKDGFKLELVPIIELEKMILDNENDNPRNKYFQKELLTILSFYKGLQEQPKQLKKEKTNNN